VCTKQCNPEGPLEVSTITDVSSASAAILADPGKHANKTIQLISNHITFYGIAAAFSEVLGKGVAYVHLVPFNRQVSLTIGLPESTVNIFEQLFKLVNGSSTKHHFQ